MLSPICDNYRLLLGIIAVLGEIIFASMTGILREDIVNLYRRIIQKNIFTKSPELLTLEARFLYSSKWLILIASFLVTILIGPYVAVVPSKTCVKLEISELLCDPEGDEYSQEYVRIKNNGNKNININNWKLCDYQNVHCYVFKNFIIKGQSTITIWTKSGVDTSTDLYFNEKSTPIWNNGRDTAYMFDTKEQLIYQLPCP